MMDGEKSAKLRLNPPRASMPAQMLVKNLKSMMMVSGNEGNYRTVDSRMKTQTQQQKQFKTMTPISSEYKSIR